MALPLAALTAGGLAAAAYLDAKFLIRNDLTTGSVSGNVNKSIAFITQRLMEDRILVYHNLEEWAEKNEPDHLFLLCEGRSWTFKQFFDDLQRVGNWLMNDLGIEKREIVAIDGGNSPEYLLLWFALDGIGAVPAFINCHLTNQPLIHSVKLCESRYLIADREIEPQVKPCEDELSQSGIKTIYYDQSFISSFSDTTRLPQSRRSGIKHDEVRSLIYTSGTTGLPKGTLMLTGRELNTGRAVAEYLKLKRGDRMYTALPLYHGAGHGLCVTPSIHAGTTVVLSKKFSHKTFWPEVSASKANILQYVGELCRYLVNAPIHPLERNHCVEQAWGNGMRPDVWEVFRQRFNIPVINELNAATDGLGSTFNYNKGEFGRNAVGVRGLIWNLRNGQNEVRVKMDVATEEILRDKNGFAIKCDFDEPGEVFYRMDPATASTAFAGYYKNDQASQKRMIRDVFQKGDLWFRSGDMMKQSASGCVYFVDRLGDTFRWKSENVSTNEVADVLGKFPSIHEANVYGAQIPHADGRCGCAAIVLDPGVPLLDFDFAGLAAHALANLPRYAVPIFVRVTDKLQYTGTFKIQKGTVKREGVDLDLIASGGSGDHVYWLPPAATKYVPFTRENWDAIKAGAVRL